MATDLLVCWAGTIAYEPAWRWQQRLRERRQAGELPDMLLILDHPPSYTIGRSTKPHHLLGDVAAIELCGIAVHQTERGGSITYHGPGQVVGYPIIDLRDRGRDIHRFIRELEEVLIRVVAQFDVRARRQSGLTGVWVGAKKIAAIGVHVRHWITMHGFALNVTTALDPFREIRPCGLDSDMVTSLQELMGTQVPDLETIRSEIRRQFDSVFNCASEEVPLKVLAPVPETSV